MTARFRVSSREISRGHVIMPKSSPPEMRPGYPKNAGAALIANLALFVAAIYFLVNQ